MDSVTYVVFLRGINVGGKALVKMAELKDAFESTGFKRVVPVLASGNVVFEARAKEPSTVKLRIEGLLEEKLGLRVSAILRTAAQIADLIKSDPFQNSQDSSLTKLQVTFLGEESEVKTGFPIKVASKDFKIAQISQGEVISIVDLSTEAGTPELMKFLEKQFGKKITTRTWQTIQKIGNLVGHD